LFDSLRGQYDLDERKHDGRGNIPELQVRLCFSNCKLASPTNVTSFHSDGPGSHAQERLFSQVGKQCAPAGWNAWAGRESTCYLSRIQMHGPGYKPASRVSWANQLTTRRPQIMRWTPSSQKTLSLRGQPRIPAKLMPF